MFVIMLKTEIIGYGPETLESSARLVTLIIVYVLISSIHVWVCFESNFFQSSFPNKMSAFLISSFSIDADLNSCQTWETTRTTTVTVTAPSQQFTVHPHSKGTVNYTIWQNTYKSDGVIRYNEPNNLWVNSPFWKTKDTWKPLKFEHQYI
jgi:Clostridium epsilon toxin ETX/Bacillus mosquitocidal toxin MTX2.